MDDHKKLLIMDINKSIWYIIEECDLDDARRSEFSKVYCEIGKLEEKTVDELLGIKLNILHIAGVDSMDEVDSAHQKLSSQLDVEFNSLFITSIVFVVILFLLIFTLYLSSEIYGFTYSVNSIGVHLTFNGQLWFNGFANFINTVAIPYSLIVDCAALRLIYELKAKGTCFQVLLGNRRELFFYIFLLPMAGVFITHHILLANKNNFIPPYIISMVVGWEIKSVVSVFSALSKKINKMLGVGNEY